VRYSERLIEHFRNPRNAGLMRDPDAVGEAEDPECRDVARFYLRLRAGRVVEARFQTYGCGPTIAASSAATEVVTGLDVRGLESLSAERIEAAVGGLPDDRRHAAQVVTAALQAAARDARRRAEEREGEGTHV
jgi:NifU-like protein involved in Fe-S cluster formation